ncbi:helix-turn-helix transcriptional regulator [Hymenobacter sp. YC55]|uniref:helix-turn-helix domain-containing protein n=1 Tax=Hymenobacter sp. YC55 TaxID=3034019 RepID=UPI0023F82716|nr:helix-turn-helix transcriptional regulator [Hymenobacter sp. YC55]MDF7813969.1 helix-turn-helix transcriptional regulator [Hymenobacter sp. YC55]
MPKLESLFEFYQHQFQKAPDTRPTDLGQVNVFRLEESLTLSTEPVQFSRRDFYKIALLRRGHSAYHYANQSLEATGPTLLFFNPQVPYTRQLLSDETTGFFCIFREEFFRGRAGINLTEQPFFRPGSLPTYPLTASQEEEVSALFEKMLTELHSDYLRKYDLLRNYTAELIHYALKLRPVDTAYQHPDAKSRLTGVFLELLERQFPIESPTRRFALRSARDFARQLAVHVNHLNYCVRATTGKTTTDHIAARLSSEAKGLLRHTNWNIAEVGYSLGFDEPAHFNYFFKKQTGLAPSAFRRL